MKEPPDRRWTVEEFLAWDDGTDRRYELVSGQIVAMAPPSEAHAAIVSNLTIRIGTQLQPPCRVLGEFGVRLPDRDDSFYQFDLAVTCAPVDPARRYIAEPEMIVEVLSPSTALHDRGRKLDHYRQLPSLKEILLVASEERRVQHWRRDGSRGQVFADIMRRELGVEIQLDPVDVTILGDRRDRLDFDLLVQNSGGDFDPDDGLVDFMTTESKFNAHSRDKQKYPFGYFSDAEVDRLVAEQSVTPDPARRRELVQQANLITSDKVAAMFVYHPVSPLVTRKEVNYPPESRIPDLVDLDLVTVAS